MKKSSIPNPKKDGKKSAKPKRTKDEVPNTRTSIISLNMKVKEDKEENNKESK